MDSTMSRDLGVDEHLSLSHLIHYNNSSDDNLGYLVDDFRQLVM